MVKRWYVLYSKPRKEQFLWQQLQSKGLEVFFPRLCLQARYCSEYRVIPLFPGYLFVHLDLESEDLGELLWHKFSNGLINYDGRPALVPDEIIDGIKAEIDVINFKNLGLPENLPDILSEVEKDYQPLLARYGLDTGSFAPGKDRNGVLARVLQEWNSTVEPEIDEEFAYNRK